LVARANETAGGNVDRLGSGVAHHVGGDADVIGAFFAALPRVFGVDREHAEFGKLGPAGDPEAAFEGAAVGGRGEEVTGQRLDRAGEQRGTGGRTRVEAVREDIVGDAAQLGIDDGVVVRRRGEVVADV